MMTTKHELKMKRSSVRNSRDTLTAQLHQLVSNKFCLFVSLIEARHYKHAVNATKVITCKFL